MKQVKHFEVRDEGSLVFIKPMTETAKEWVKENVHLNSWNHFAGGFGCEHRYADDILTGMAEDIGGIYLVN